MPTLDPLALVGTTVSEKYEIQEVVGEGGFAIVYRATHTVWQRPVAIKVFRALGDLPAERRDQLVKSFIQEGALLAELSERSAAICQARDVGMLRTAEGREMPYMVLEWLEGRSLEQVLDDEKSRRLMPRTPAETLHILEPAALALALAHRKGIAHRDVKPANIFVIGDPRGEYTVKILDFGIAKVVQDVQRQAGAFQQTQGVVSSFTPAYGAPEQFSRTHGATGPWTDVFALALIFTELMTNEPPLRGDDLTQLAFCSMDPKRRPTPRAYGFEISDALEAALRRALAVAPDERYRSTGEFWEALRTALAMEPMRAFAGADSSRAAGSNPQVTALAVPDSGALGSRASLTPQAPNTMTAPLGNPTTTRTMATPDPSLVPMPPSAPASTSTSTGVLFAGLGAAVVLLAGLLAGAVYIFALRGKDGVVAPVTSASVMASASAAPVLAAPPTCPAGMILIEGGKFFMGSDDKKDDEAERPAHQVTLSAFCIDTTEVTVAQYKQCSDKGECKRAPRDNEWPGITARERKIYDPLCTIRDPETKAQHPINCVDWELSDAFCKASGRRLPTEAEWEFATRGSDGRKYPWGDEPPTTGNRLNACGKECLAWGKKNNEEVSAMYPADDGFATTAPVGSFPRGASPFGLQDVVGNVWEWAHDWYAPYTPGAQTDPVGGTGAERVLRGGAWNGSDPGWVRPTYRFKSEPGLRSHGIGFRCAKELK
ncbi:MAG TPA: bifunctional serine/threonine-protein kinase/formylglycine-generating enzyme family protein [Labilithrix sp.]|nr:bifunctional serine/threonine-protein kinase/formylglycine-generating enzyme family protein [Labilithrix sp.]